MPFEVSIVNAKGHSTGSGISITRYDLRVHSPGKHRHWGKSPGTPGYDPKKNGDAVTIMSRTSGKGPSQQMQRVRDLIETRISRVKRLDRAVEIAHEVLTEEEIVP